MNDAIGSCDVSVAVGQAVVPQDPLLVSAADHGAAGVDGAGPEERQARHQIRQLDVRLLGLQPVRHLLHHEYRLDRYLVLLDGVVGGADWMALLYTICR